MAALVPLKRDFRFPSTQMPANIRGRSLYISHGQIRCADYRSRDNDRSPARHRIARSRIAVKNIHHSSGRRSQNSPPRNGNNRITVDFGAIDSGWKGHDLSPLRILCRHNGERTFYLSRRIWTVVILFGKDKNTFGGTAIPPGTTGFL